MAKILLAMDTFQEIITANLTTPSRLDKYLSNTFNAYSRHYFEKLISQGLVLINNTRAKKRFVVEQGDKISITFTIPNPLELTPYDFPLSILYEDEDLIAVNKPSGLVVHPAPGHYQNTLVNALIHHLGAFKGFENTLRPGIIHRLDKDTSGVILCAKTPFGHKFMTELFSKRLIEKQYLALCHNRPLVEEVNAPIKRHPSKRKEMTLHQEGKPAITKFKVLHYDERYSLVLAQPITGRTHQIRVHLKSLNCPIVSDVIYGHKSDKYPRLMLHAKSLGFVHPQTQKPLIIEAEPDETFSHLLEKTKSPFQMI